MKNLVKPKPTVQEHFQDFPLRTCYIIELTYCFFCPNDYFCEFTYNSVPRKCAFVSIYTPNGGMSCPAHICTVPSQSYAPTRKEDFCCSRVLGSRWMLSLMTCCGFQEGEAYSSHLFPHLTSSSKPHFQTFG